MMQRPRWYGLDDPFIHEKLKQCPRLLTWVVNTDDIAKLQAQTSFAFGETMLVNRDDLTWNFAVPDDGRILAGGMLPYLIQWHTDSHPARRMADRGCRLINLEIHHPYADWVSSILSDIGAMDLATVQSLEQGTAPFLLAHLDTPSGVQVLDSRR